MMGGKRSMAKNNNNHKDTTDYSIPDRSHGDLYCALCESHMNSQAMWQAHIIGKKHIKNLNKEGDVEKKYETLKQRCSLKEELDNIDDVVVGLKHIHEIYRKNTTAPIYMCYLCNSNISMGNLLIEHVLSYKHRLAYVKENDPKSYNSLDFSNFSKGALEDLVFGMARTLEIRLGRGEITVKKEIERKEEIYTWSSKKAPVTPPLPSSDRFFSHDDRSRSSGKYPLKNEVVDLPRRYERSPSLHRRIHSPTRRSLRSPSFASPHRVLHSPSPRRRLRSPTPHRSPRRRHIRPGKKSKKEREDRGKIHREKLLKRHRSRSSSSTGSSNSSSHNDKHHQSHRSTEGAQSSHSNQCGVNSRIPSFNVLHHSPVQHAARMITPTFISPGAHGREMPSSAMQTAFMNQINNQIAMNTLTSRNISVGDIEHSLNNHSFEHVKRMVDQLPTGEFLKIFYSKLDNLLCNSTEDIQILESLHTNIGKVLMNRRSVQMQNLYATASVVPQEIFHRDARLHSSPNQMRARVHGPPQPLDDFLAMVRKNGLQPSPERQNTVMIPGLDNI